MLRFTKILSGSLIILFLILLAIVFFTSCETLKTQATQNEGEISECFYARYFAREGQKESTLLLADKCFKVLREQGCIKVIKENPDIYRDFNDCWKTRE